MTRRRKLLWLLIAALGGVVTLGAVVVVARAAIPSWLRSTIERAASEALGRELRIAGRFDISPSLAPRLVAEEVTLANAPWGSEPAMVRVAHVEASLDLLSLWAPPVRITDVAIRGVRVLLETDAAGRGNWEFERKPPPAPPRPEPSARPPVVFDRATIRELELIHRPRREAPSLRLGIARLEARLEPATGMIDLDAAGHFNDAPWDLSGRLGSFDHLYALRDVEQAVTGQIGGSKIALRGRIRDPLALGGPDLEVEIRGPDVAAALATVGLRSPLEGPFEFLGRISPARDGIDLDLNAALAGVTAALRGRAGSLLEPGAVDAAAHVSGPDASVVGGWIGVGGLPPLPFEVSGRVRRTGPAFRIDDAKIRVGGTSVAVSGTVGEPPRCAGTDLAVAAEGRDLSELSALTRLHLPAGRFAARGRFLRRADALAFEDVDIQTAGAALQASGAIGLPPRFESLDVTVRASGPDLSWLSGIATVALPQAPFALDGRVAGRGATLELDGLQGHLGDDAVTLQGSIVPSPRLAGSDLHARITGPDLAKAASLAGLHGLPAEAYEISGRVRLTPDGFDLEGVEARAGRISAKVGGRMGFHPTEDGAALDLQVRGPALSDLAAWGVPATLPGDPFIVTGRLRIEGGAYHVDRATVEVGADRASLDGTLGHLPDLTALDVAVEGSGPRLADIGRFITAVGGEPPGRLPAEPYAFSGRVRRLPAGFDLREARITIGDAEIRLDGALGSGAGLRGTDLRFEARAPDASLVAPLVGATPPAGPVEIRGRLDRIDAGVRLDGVAASIGDVHAEISGTLGAPPTFAGTDLEVSVAGPRLDAALGPPTGLSALPAEAFEASAHVEGSVERFVSERFSVRLGENDLEGSVSVRLEGRPLVEADLRSSHLGVSQLLDGFAGDPAEAPALAAAGESQRSPRGRIIPDVPLALDALRSLDAQVRLKVAELVIPGMPLRDVAVEGNVRDGALRLDRIEGSGRSGGRATANLSVEPHEGAYRVQASGGITGGRIDLSKTGESPDQAPSLDVEFAVEGVGRSLHEIAASSAGRALITLGPGRIPGNARDFVTSGVLRGLLDALNPFSKSSPYTTFECGVVAAGIDNGKATVAPIAARTDKLTVIGHGKIDFETEGIDLVWTLKTRKGVGISAASIANPYIKLGGTLSSPSLDAKPLEAAASTGAAVATAGMTILFKGMYDRITAEKKVCLHALEEVQRQEQERETGKRD